MTWEWAALLSVLAGLSTIIWLNRDGDKPEIATSIDGIADRLSQLENDHATITQLAESTKKLLSEANVAKGLRPQR